MAENADLAQRSLLEGAVVAPAHRELPGGEGAAAQRPADGFDIAATEGGELRRRKADDDTSRRVTILNSRTAC